MKLNLKVILIFLILFIIVVFGIILTKKGADKSQYQVSKVLSRNIIETVEASGTINPVQTVNIGSQTSGMIKYIYADFNSNVKKGQVLAQLDPAIPEYQVQQDRAALYAKKAEYERKKSLVEYDRARYNRYKVLYKKEYVSKDDVEYYYKELKANMGDLKALSDTVLQAQEKLKSSLQTLEYTRIKSPVNGVVVSRDVDVGQTVAASFQTPTLFKVAQDLTKMQIEVSVSEADIGKVKAGQIVEYTLDGYPNETFKGRVKQVRLASTVTSNVVTYTVIVSVDNQKGILMPGMTANVSIIVKSKNNIKCVENAALKYTPVNITEGKKFKQQGIWILTKKGPKRINIETGLSDSDYTEIITEEISLDNLVIIGDKTTAKSNKKDSMHPPRMF